MQNGQKVNNDRTFYFHNIFTPTHRSNVIMSVMASQINGVLIVCLAADQIKHQSPASLAFVRVIHRWPMDPHHKGLVLFPAIMNNLPQISMRSTWAIVIQNAVTGCNVMPYCYNDD